jgi:hypothetical protein
VLWVEQVRDTDWARSICGLPDTGASRRRHVGEVGDGSQAVQGAQQLVVPSPSPATLTGIDESEALGAQGGPIAVVVPHVPTLAPVPTLATWPSCSDLARTWSISSSSV